MENSPRAKLKLISLAVLVLVGIWGVWRGFKDGDALQDIPKEQVASKAVGSPKPSPAATSQPATSGLRSSASSTMQNHGGTFPDKQEQPNPLSAQSSDELIKNTNMLAGASLKLAVQELKARDRPVLLQTLRENYLRAADHDPLLREKTLWFAKELNGPELVGLWRDVVMRTTPASPQEPELNANEVLDHNNPEHVSRLTEQYLAIEALGDLQSESAEARLQLWSIAQSTAARARLNVALRLAAVRELQAVEPATLLKLSAALAPSDPLRRQLQDWAKSDNERGAR